MLLEWEMQYVAKAWSDPKQQITADIAVVWRACESVNSFRSGLHSAEWARMRLHDSRYLEYPLEPTEIASSWLDCASLFIFGGLGLVSSSARVPRNFHCSPHISGRSRGKPDITTEERVESKNWISQSDDTAHRAGEWRPDIRWSGRNFKINLFSAVFPRSRLRLCGGAVVRAAKKRRSKRSKRRSRARDVDAKLCKNYRILGIEQSRHRFFLHNVELRGAGAGACGRAWNHLEISQYKLTAWIWYSPELLTPRRAPLTEDSRAQRAERVKSREKMNILATPAHSLTGVLFVKTWISSKPVINWNSSRLRGEFRQLSSAKPIAAENTVKNRGKSSRNGVKSACEVEKT